MDWAHIDVYEFLRIYDKKNYKLDDEIERFIAKNNNINKIKKFKAKKKSKENNELKKIEEYIEIPKLIKIQEIDEIKKINKTSNHFKELKGFDELKEFTELKEYKECNNCMEFCKNGRSDIEAITTIRMALRIIYEALGDIEKNRICKNISVIMKGISDTKEGTNKIKEIINKSF